jgi:hypothetical protein
MAVSINKKYRFVSPGVFLNEIDNSQLPKLAAPIGPVIIGRTERGPGMIPVQIDSFSDFVEIFGNTVPGGSGDDVWRQGNYTSPMYATYAAQAWLKNSSRATIVRLLGDESDTATGTRAGWKAGSPSTNDGNAYGFFVIDSGSALSSATTGTLGAVFYCNSGYQFQVSGTIKDGSAVTAATSSLIKNESNSGLTYFVGQISSSSGVVAKAKFCFDENSEYYIRKVFNTNPTLVNSTISSTTLNYWLGETYEENVRNIINISTVNNYGVSLLLSKANGGNYANRQASSQIGTTGWIIGQDLGTSSAFDVTSVQQLFQIKDLYSGESNQRRFKISIKDIKPSSNVAIPYGTFSIVVREASDNDANPKIVETFANCNLNPLSENYVAKKIGDQFMSWSDTTNSYTLVGNYPNQSKFIRIVMNSDVDAGSINPAYLPFGCQLPPRPAGFTIKDDAVAGGSDLAVGGLTINSGSTRWIATINMTYPKFVLRNDTVTGSLSAPSNAYWGVTYNKKTNLLSADKSYTDLIRYYPSRGTAAATDYFTLDDISGSSLTANSFTYVSGSRLAGSSLTAKFSYTSSLDAGIDKFNVPMYGGFDGLDVRESDPFRNNGLTDATPTTHYAYYSILKALNSVNDPERVEMNLLAIPGITNASVTNQMIQTAENRADTLAVIDLPAIYTPRHESKTYGLGNGATTGYGSSNLDNVVSTFKQRNINSSYACTYYPWVKVTDTINNSTLWVPPSVIALGVFSTTDNKAEPWFAPAGFTRGGLSEGAAGIPVVQVSEQLTSKQRDKLYEVNINPIAQFPAEGIVVFGQKTLQVTRSALDRINVRRLMIYVKKEVSRIAARLLFSPNVQATWNVFLGQVNPLMASIKTRFGLDDYKVILDNTTTTPDLIDQNIMYAKIFLKPTRAIEFIAIDFVITNSGASFED